MNNAPPSFVPDASFWEISSPTAYWLFLEALPKLLPGGSILYLEGTSMSAQVKDFLQGQAIAPDTTIPRGTIWPRPHTYHIPNTEYALHALAELAQNAAGPEICDHILGYKDNQSLLIWYDAFMDTPLYLSKEIEEESVRLLCRTLQCSYSSFI